MTIASRFQVSRVEVDSDDAAGAGGIDVLKAITTCDAENGDRSGTTEAEGLPEKVRECRELLDIGGAHVAFIVGERDVQPGIGHESTAYFSMGK